MTAVTYPTIRRQRNRLRSIAAVALLAAATIVLSERETIATRPANRAVAHARVAPAELYATAVAP